MHSESIQQSSSELDMRLLAEFIHELNIARRNLTLYPPEHPQIAASIATTLEMLDKLLIPRAKVTFGVAPDALLFEHSWLDKDNPAYRQFAAFLSGFGIASLSFSRGLTAGQLIRFTQLLRSDRDSVEDAGGFESLLLQQQVHAISVVPIDYSAFQSSSDPDKPKSGGEIPLWDDFLHGLLDGILDFGTEGSHLDPVEVAKILNERLVAGGDGSQPSSPPVNRFVSRMIDSGLPAEQQELSGQQLGSLLEHLSPQLQQSFLSETFQVLEQDPAAAENFLQKFPTSLLQKALSGPGRQTLKISSRLVDLVGRLAAGAAPNFDHKIKSDATPLSKDMVRARLDVLFSEEDQDLYLPGQYQSALRNIIQEDMSSVIPEEEKEQLKNALEKQVVERQCGAVIFELLRAPLDPDTEESIQQNLVELSRFFLDTGDFVTLRDIFSSWSDYLYSGISNASIFDEKVLANHTQMAFMAEVLDGIDLWGKEQYQNISDYIAVVGEPYAELVIERLGLARQMPERSFWMQVLERIGGDANQLIIQALVDERWYLIRNLLIVLSKQLDATNLKAINQFAAHPHPKVRQEVIRALFRCNPATANRLLLKDLNSPNPEAQQAAIQVADLSRDPEVLTLLHHWLQTEMTSDLDLELREQLLHTLARSGNRDSLSILRALLRKKGLLQSRRQKLLQQAIIKSLPKYPHAEAEKLLQEIAAGYQRQLAKLAATELRQLSGEAL